MNSHNVENDRRSLPAAFGLALLAILSLLCGVQRAEAQFSLYKHMSSGLVYVGSGDSVRIEHLDEVSATYDITAAGEIIWTDTLIPGQTVTVVPPDHPAPTRIVTTRMGVVSGSTNIDAMCARDCLAFSTQVMTPDGLRSIGSIRAGDTVSSADGPVSVVRVNKSQTVELIRTSVRGLTVETSLGHRFLTKHRGWVAARFLRPGVVLIGRDGMPLIIERVVRKTLRRPAAVYNLVLDGEQPVSIGAFGVHVETSRLATAR